jgi:hypothetical protein
MAVHRDRIDLLGEHLRHDPALLRRTFTHAEIYSPELGCHDYVLATQGIPLAGTALLHLCVDYDEMEIARWLLEQGMDVSVAATLDADGFGGHTAPFRHSGIAAELLDELPESTAGGSLCPVAAGTRR